MSLTLEIQSDLEKLVNDLRSAEQKADDKLRGINVRAARQLLAVARQVVHVRSKRLRDSLSIKGPFNVATGTLEARVVARAPYADEEIARGGEHDFAQRTLDEGQDIIDQAAEDMEQALIAIIEGRA